MTPAPSSPATHPAKRLTILVHGESGAGKSWLFNTGPGPRLLLDAEGRAEYLADLRADPTGMTPQRLVSWNPRDPIPEESADPSVVTVVDVLDFDTLKLAYQWLSSGNHPFRTVGLDSLQETQQRLMDATAGTEQLQMQHWGSVLREMDALIRKFRDLRKNPVSPVDCVVVLAGSQEKNDKIRPMLQGGMILRAPFHFDVVGYLRKGISAEGQRVRYLTIDGYADEHIVAKDNTHRLSGHYGEHIPFPDLEQMLGVLNAGAPATGTHTTQEVTNP